MPGKTGLAPKEKVTKEKEKEKVAVKPQGCGTDRPTQQSHEFCPATVCCRTRPSEEMGKIRFCENHGGTLFESWVCYRDVLPIWLNQGDDENELLDYQGLFKQDCNCRQCVENKVFFKQEQECTLGIGDEDDDEEEISTPEVAMMSIFVKMSRTQRRNERRRTVRMQKRMQEGGQDQAHKPDDNTAIAAHWNEFQTRHVQQEF